MNLIPSVRVDLLTLAAKLEGVHDKWWLIHCGPERAIAKFYAMVIREFADSGTPEDFLTLLSCLNRAGLDSMTLQVYEFLDEILEAYKG